MNGIEERDLENRVFVGYVYVAGRDSAYLLNDLFRMYYREGEMGINYLV